jgi:hypothetical protein
MRLLHLALPTVSVVMLSTLGLATLGSLASAGNDEIVGSGKRASAVRTVGAFRGIALNSSVDLEFRTGPTQRVELIGDDNLVPLITTTVRDGSLTIDTGKARFTTHNPLRAVITAPSLEGLSIRGSGDATLEGLDAKSFGVAIRGSGDVCLRGRVGSLGVSVDGSGDIQAQDLAAASAAIQLNGSGDITVKATESVAASINGSGDVRVLGKPKSVVKTVNGSGSFHVD